MTNIPPKALKEDWKAYIMEVMESGLMPKDIREVKVKKDGRDVYVTRSPEQQIARAAVKIRFAYDLDIDIPASVALDQVTLVHGNLDIQSKLALALIRKRCPKALIWIDAQYGKSIIKVDRLGDGRVINTYEFEFKEAVAAEVTGKAVWQHWQRIMIGYKNVKLVSAFEFPDITMGLGNGIGQISGMEDSPQLEGPEESTLADKFLPKSEPTEILENKTEPALPQIPEKVELPKEVKPKKTITIPKKKPMIDASSEATKTGAKALKTLMGDIPVPNTKEEVKAEESMELDLGFLEEKEAQPKTETLEEGYERVGKEIEDLVTKEVEEAIPTPKADKPKRKRRPVMPKVNWAHLNDMDAHEADLKKVFKGNDQFSSETAKSRLPRDFPYMVLQGVITSEALTNGFNMDTISKIFAENFKDKSRQDTNVDVLLGSFQDYLNETKQTKFFDVIRDSFESRMFKPCQFLIQCVQEIFETEKNIDGSEFFTQINAKTGWDSEKNREKNYHLWAMNFLSKRHIIQTDGSNVKYLGE